MRKSGYQSRAQLVLELERPDSKRAAEPSIKGLVETLADLLLEALGVAEMPAVGGVDEHQDHA